MFKNGNNLVQPTRQLLAVRSQPVKLKPFSVIGTILLTWALTLTSALANCSDRPGSTEWYAPVMAEHSQRLKRDPTYSEAGVLDRIEGSNIYLTAKFDSLAGDRKRYVINSLLDLDFSDYLTSEELAAKYEGPGSEGRSTWPYNIVASDAAACSKSTMAARPLRY